MCFNHRVVICRQKEQVLLNMSSTIQKKWALGGSWHKLILPVCLWAIRYAFILDKHLPDQIGSTLVGGIWSNKWAADMGARQIGNGQEVIGTETTYHSSLYCVYNNMYIHIYVYRCFVYTERYVDIYMHIHDNCMASHVVCDVAHCLMPLALLVG